MFSFKKSQGEIFGIALLFVVIIIGVLIYGKIQALNPDNSVDEVKEAKYKVLAEGTLNSILKMSTGCFIERNNDKLVDLINYCVENSRMTYNDPEVDCGDLGVKNSCSFAKELIGSTLHGFLDSDVLGPIPYKLIVTLPSDRSDILNENYSNFGEFMYGDKILVETNEEGDENKITYREAGFNRAPSGIRGWSTSKRNIDFELYLYYR